VLILKTSLFVYLFCIIKKLATLKHPLKKNSGAAIISAQKSSFINLQLYFCKVAKQKLN